MKSYKLSLKVSTGIIILALLLTSIAVPFAVAATTVVRFDPGAANVSVGQTVAVNIRVDDVTSLAGVQFQISYNPAIVEVQDANPNSDGVQIATGSFLQADFVAQNVVDTSQGKIDFSVVQLPPHSPVSGSGVLATITFKAKNSGSSPLTFNIAYLSDGNAAAISFSPQNGQITVVGGGSTQPTPTWTPVPGQPTPTPIPPQPTPVPGQPTPTPLPTPSGNILGYHTVRYRETLFCIGRAYSVLPWAIASQNNVGYPYQLYIGQVLAIPNVPWTNMSAGPVCPPQFGGGTPPTPPPPPPPSGCRASYVVRYGDTLSSIAWRFGTTAWAIAARNNLSNPNLIFPGQTLCIP